MLFSRNRHLCIICNQSAHQRNHCNDQSYTLWLHLSCTPFSMPEISKWFGINNTKTRLPLDNILPAFDWHPHKLSRDIRGVRQPSWYMLILFEVGILEVWHQSFFKLYVRVISVSYVHVVGFTVMSGHNDPYCLYPWTFVSISGQRGLINWKYFRTLQIPQMDTEMFFFCHGCTQMNTDESHKTIRLYVALE